MSTESQGEYALKTEINALYLEILDDSPLSRSDRIILAADDLGDRAIQFDELSEKVDAHRIISGQASRFAVILALLRSPKLLTNIDIEEYGRERAQLTDQMRLADLALKTMTEGVRTGYGLTPRQTKKAVKISRKRNS